MIFIILSSLAVGVDASCCNVVNGCNSNSRKTMFITSTSFTLFQVLMIFFGYILSIQFGEKILKVGNYLAFALLTYLSLVSFASLRKKEEDNKELSLKNILMQSIATSIDALAVGISYVAINANISIGLLVVIITTFIMTLFAYIIGNKLGTKLNNSAKVIGGLVFLILAIKILIT